ncbi:MAG: hypothetical protein WCA63_08390, partial [Gallionella sp.]
MRETFKRFIGMAIGYIKHGMISFKKHEMSRRYICRLLKEKKPIFLEVGSGDKKGKNGWITTDLSANSDIYWDLRKGIP